MRDLIKKRDIDMFALHYTFRDLEILSPHHYLSALSD